MTPEQERFMRNVEVAPNGCWIWQRACSSSGYGVSTIPGKPTKVTSAYRVSYELFIGPIPKGLHLHHECRNGRCANPYHVRPVTSQENILIGLMDRGIWPASHMCRAWCGKRVGAHGGRCRRCQKIETNATNRARIIAAVKRYATLYGEPPSATCWNVGMARRTGRVDLVARYETGDWPSTTLVQHVFGSWSNAIAAAGFTPTPAGHYDRERARARRKERLAA